MMRSTKDKKSRGNGDDGLIFGGPCDKDCGIGSTGVNSILDHIKRLESRIQDLEEDNAANEISLSEKAYPYVTPREATTTTPANIFRTHEHNHGMTSGPFNSDQLGLEANTQDLFHTNVMALLQNLQDEATQQEIGQDKALKGVANAIGGDSFGSIILNKIKGLREKLKDNEDDEKFPQDCYSFIALNGPAQNQWPRENIVFFCFGLLVFFFQLGFLILLILSRADLISVDADADNPSPNFQFIPASATPLVRVSQVISILAYTLFPNASLMDVFQACLLFQRTTKATNLPIGYIRLSCILRGLQGYLATIAVFLVVITSGTVLDIILNFTALDFISGLDDDAFSLAKTGMLGVALRKEAERIEGMKVPPRTRKKQVCKTVLYWCVMGSTTAILLVLLFSIIALQNSPDVWVTTSFRVEFDEETGLKDHSGCYEIKRDLRFANRYSYHNGIDPTVSFGYCRHEFRWIFFNDDGQDVAPCDATDMGMELARSEETGAYDIGKSFEESWFYPSSQIPLKLYFEVGEEDNLNCDLSLGDGHCDDPFNIPSKQFDNGDCCAATCTMPACGGGGFTNAFGIPNIRGIGFPNCVDPQSVPITIHMNEILSSRSEAYTEYDPCWWNDATESEIEWRTQPPEKASFVLECNDVVVLSIDIDKSMENNTETIMVEDGANCKLTVEGSKQNFFPPGTDQFNFMKAVEWGKTNYCDDPIWFVNYTIFHQKESATGMEEIEIITQHSSKKETEWFRRIPECYITSLEDFIDSTSIYTSQSPATKALKWLMEDDSSHSECEHLFFFERFALTLFDFAMDGVTKWATSKQTQCDWPGIKCTVQGQVNQVILPERKLKGEFPSELMLLHGLETLSLSKLTVWW